MKHTHKRSRISIAIAAIVLVSLCVVCASPLSVSAADGSNTNVQAPALAGATIASSPAVCAQDANSLDLFAKGTDGALWYKQQSGQDWSAWTSLGGFVTADPAAVSWGNGRIDVFVRGGDGALWHKYYQNGWSGWEPLGGQLLPNTGPAVSSGAAGRLDVFVAGTDYQLWHKYWQNGWSGWEPLGGYLTSSPAATASGQGVMDVFARGSDSGLWQRVYNNGWSGWEPLGEQIAPGTGPAACSWGAGRLDVFVTGMDGALWHRWNNGAWSGWEPLGGYLTSSPAATSPTSGVMDVFARGGDSGLWEMIYNAGWSGWTSIGREPTNTTFPAAPSAVTSVPVNAVPAYVIIAVASGLMVALLYLYARRGIRGLGEEEQRPSDGISTSGESALAVENQRAIVGAGTSGATSSAPGRNVVPRGVWAEGRGKYSRAHAEVLVTHATRAALASATRARTVFNLAWYELLAIFLILTGEGLLFAGYRVLGVGVQALNIVAVAVIVVALNVERLQLIQALALVSVFRVVNLSFVLVPTVTLYWLAIIYGVMFLPIISIIVHEKLSRHDLGIDDVRRSVVLLPLGAVIGVGFGVLEYAILANNALIPNASVSQLIQLSIVMIFFVALVEELLFRVLLQSPLIERTGAIAGILIAGVIFGAMHSGYANGYELLFAIGAGVIFGVAFYETKNLAFVVTIHAVNNIILFGMPAFLTH